MKCGYKKIFFLKKKIIKKTAKQQDFKKIKKVYMWKFFEYFNYLIVRELDFYKI